MSSVQVHPQLYTRVAIKNATIPGTMYALGPDAIPTTPEVSSALLSAGVSPVAPRPVLVILKMHRRQLIINKTLNKV